MAFSLFGKNISKNLTIRSNSGHLLRKQYCVAQNAIQKSSEEVKYPPIVDQSKKAVQEREKMSWHEQVKKLETIEEKLIKVNMPAYWGLRTTPLVNDEYHYNCFPHFQHWTRTQYENELPKSWFKRSAEEVDGLINNVRDHIIEAITFQYQGYRYELI